MSENIEISDPDVQVEDQSISSNEYEQEPVPEHKLKGWKHFWGLFSGEHVAGTEFVIGATFVAWGVSTFDVIWGLIIGNLLAVLTWTFVCAPIATDTRLTLYEYLKKIAGPSMTKIYNVVNAILFCVLGGSMITVSASAVRILFDIPPQTNWYPTSVAFVLVALAVGAVITAIAILGFDGLAQFATVCSPWLLVMFVSGALVALPQVINLTDGVTGLSGFADFVKLADKSIWTGSNPSGESPMGFWHVVAFAWICNLAMHGGLSDMTILRYAKTYKYGFLSAFGMFFGHYLAWICAGIMGAGAALVLNTSIINLDAGAVAYQSLGVVGILAVIIAGWTTSNPTIYRAGLAFQSIFDKYSRETVTLITGILVTVIACFPFVFTKLSGFISYMGLLLVPVGTVIFTEHWIFPKIGYTRYWSHYKGNELNVPALISWIIGVLFALTMDNLGFLHSFFLLIPTWIVTTIAYIVLAGNAGAKEDYPKEKEKDLERLRKIEERQRREAKLEKENEVGEKVNRDVSYYITGVIAGGSLFALVVMAIQVFLSNDYKLSYSFYKNYALVPTILYFIFGTIWMRKKDQLDKDNG